MTKIPLFIALLLTICACGSSRRAISVDHNGDDEIDIGYGTITNDRRTTANSRLNPGDDAQTYSDIYSYIQGRVAGVTVIGTRITIRGVDSVYGDSAPLILVNNVEVSDISHIAPDMVESIDVIKDASGASIYGVRGGNGVILIKLKEYSPDSGKEK